jgi:biotin-(acetyl-CoA carboxylase) ligase
MKDHEVAGVKKDEPASGDLDSLKKEYANVLDEIKSLYDKYLYHKDKLSVFEDLSNQRFMGIIRQVNDDGKLIIEKENNVFESYEFKQIITLLNYKVS